MPTAALSGSEGYEAKEQLWQAGPFSHSRCRVVKIGLVLDSVALLLCLVSDWTDFFFLFYSRLGQRYVTDDGQESSCWLPFVTPRVTRPLVKMSPNSLLGSDLEALLS